MNHEKGYNQIKHILGIFLILIYASGSGFLLFRYLPGAILWTQEKVSNKGPLIIVVLIILFGISFLISFAEGFLAETFLPRPNKVLGIICGLLIGLPVTILLGRDYWLNLYMDAWSGLGFFLIGGVAPGVLTYFFIGNPDVMN